MHLVLSHVDTEWRLFAVILNAADCLGIFGWMLADVFVGYRASYLP